MRISHVLSLLTTVLKLSFIITLVSFFPFFSEVKGQKDDQLSKLIDEYYIESLRFNPIQATANGFHEYDGKLGISISEEYRNNYSIFLRQYKSELKGFQKANLVDQERINFDVMSWDIDINLELLSHPTHLLPVNQLSSMPLVFAQLGSGASVHPFNNVKDYENFIERSKEFEKWIDLSILNMKEGLSTGIVEPSVVIERLIPQLESIIKENPEESIFYTPIDNIPDGFSEEEIKQLKTLYLVAINSIINPSYIKLKTFLETEYLEGTRENFGLTGLPKGESIYTTNIKYWTTTNLTPDEIHDLGVNEVERILKEMKDVLENELNFSGSPREFFGSRGGEYNIFKTQEDVLNGFREIENAISPHLDSYFELKPKTPFEVRKVEDFRSASASASYTRGAPDGSRPGIFYVPISNPEQYSSIGMESLFLHEAIPGHHYQISIQQELEGLPLLRRFSTFGAFTEGWALYTENLGEELGLYKDPVQHLGKLGSELLRGVRLVVDTGLHHKGWSREEAIEYMISKNYPRGFASNQIERYMVLPGQALSYKIGEMTILKLREEAKEKMGSNFVLKDFHTEVLKNGSLPLTVMERNLRNWINSNH